MPAERKTELTGEYDALMAHQNATKKKEDLQAFLMHCQSRINHDETTCILTVASQQYPEVIKAIQMAMFAIYKVTPESGPAPATKRERKAMRIAAKYNKK